MIKQSLAEEREVELLMNDEGFVMLLYAGGPLNHKYQWVQFDEQARKLEFITENGGIQEFGIKIFDQFVKPLKTSDNIVLFQVTEDKKLDTPQMIKITRTAH